MLSQPLAASEEETELATRLLVIAKCERAGVLNPEAAIDIFRRSGLSFELLRDIWNIADKNGSGDLSKDELVVAIRLMGWTQAGEALHDGLVTKCGPLPTLEGITDAVKKPNHVHQTPQFPPINTVDVLNFKGIFIRAGPINGILDGDKVMDAFMTSNLSYEHLWKIKMLVDRNESGGLDFREFAMGMYLIHAFQSCLISVVPTSIPQDLHDQFADLEIPSSAPSSSLPPQSRRPTPSLRASSSKPHLSTPVSGNSTPLSTNHEHEEHWAILPHEKIESDKHFYKLDLNRKGYIEMDTAAKFMLSYDLSQADLGHIWMLADLNKDNRLTADEFAILSHLLRQRSAGEPVPQTLPPSLIPPSLRSWALSNMSSAPVSPIQKAKPPPPPPKKDRASMFIPNGHVLRAQSSSAALSTVFPDSKYSTPLSPPLSPTPSIHRPRASSSVAPMSFLTSPKPKSRSSSRELLSPFEDPAAELHNFSLSRHNTPPLSPRPPESASNEALEGFKKETARLSLQVESLLSQLTEQSRLRDGNEALRRENESLKSQLHDMERTVSEVLSANDRLGSQDEYIEEIGRLTAELATKDTQSENSERMVAMLREDEQELRASLRESQAATAKAKNEAEELRKTVSTQSEEIKELNGRVADMSKAMSEPTSTTNNRELRVLLRDATRENESLKGQLRDTQKSMEQLLLSSKGPTQLDELRRENRRLKEQIQELELIATTVQSSSMPSSSSRSTESLTRENEHLRQQLRDGQRTFADFRSTNETKFVEMRQQIDSLTHENNRLKIDVNASRRRQPQTQEDNSVPPPAYDDSFVIPP
ncbi:hypothetical protein BDZ97DRAFT_1892340 [Flammula alnicola]|nr:hypothetical protein BDZ97DRAFT_1892340 [Flammula alnicola]